MQFSSGFNDLLNYHMEAIGRRELNERRKQRQLDSETPTVVHGKRLNSAGYNEWLRKVELLIRSGSFSPFFSMTAFNRYSFYSSLSLSLSLRVFISALMLNLTCIHLFWDGRVYLLGHLSLWLNSVSQWSINGVYHPNETVCFVLRYNCVVLGFTIDKRASTEM